MIKVSVLYPNAENATFDMKYYLDSHMPMVRARLGTALKGMAVEQGLSGGEPGSRPTYIAFGHLFFDSVATFQAAFDANAPAILSDIPNYTNQQPVVQISEVKL